MGLYIPGTYIRGCGVGGPIGCGCPCYNPYNGRCQVVNKDVGDPSVLGFPDFCPIVRVQSPHGKLGDLDALINKIGENVDKAKDRSYDWWYACTVAYDFALAAPTIIPAEED